MKSPSKSGCLCRADSNVDRPARCIATSPSTKMNDASPFSSAPHPPMTRREYDSDSTASRNASSNLESLIELCASCRKPRARATFEPGRTVPAIRVALLRSSDALSISVRARSSAEGRALTYARYPRTLPAATTTIRMPQVAIFWIGMMNQSRSAPTSFRLRITFVIGGTYPVWLIAHSPGALL
jgi:hypothetical protein